MAEWTTVAASGDVEEGGLLEVDNRGEPVVIARRGSGLYAFEGYCTHEECPLSEGQFVAHRGRVLGVAEEEEVGHRGNVPRRAASPRG